MNLEQRVNKAAHDMCSYYYYKYYSANKSEQIAEISLKQRKELLKNNYTFQFCKKNFKYFLKAAEMFSEREGFEAELFIDSVLGEGFLYPPQIPVERNWKIYLRNSQEKEVVSNTVIDDAKRVKRFFAFLNGRSIKDITNSYILSQDLCKQYADDTLDLIVLCFSKSFKEFSKKERMFIDFSDEQSKIDIRLKNKIKEKLGDDFEEEE